MRILFCAYLILLLSSCVKNEAIPEPTYTATPVVKVTTLRFAVHPLHNPEHLIEVFEPLIHYLNKNIPNRTIQLEASHNYAAFEEKLRKQEVDFALPNPYQTLLAIKYGYRVFAKMGDDQNFRGIILVRKDSGINTFAQLKGKTISYPAPTALAATMLPQYLLYKNGLDVTKDTKSLYVGSQESSIMNVYLKTSQAGGTWPPPWQAFVKSNPERAKELEVRWQTAPLLNNALVARKDLPQDLVQKVQRLLLDLQNTEEGRTVLSKIGLSKFETATDKTYEPVQTFINQFTKKVRPPESKR